MSRRAKIYLLIGLLTVLAGVVATQWSVSPEFAAVLSSSERFQPLSVENPALRHDLLEQIRKVEYTGTHRNIFNFSLPPPPPPVQKAPDPPRAGGDGSGTVGEAPLQVPARFYGYASDPVSGRRRAFFTNGEDVWILAEGEILLRRFRLLRIGNTTADMEEIQTGRRATLQMEAAPTGGL